MTLNIKLITFMSSSIQGIIYDPIVFNGLKIESTF